MTRNATVLTVSAINNINQERANTEDYYNPQSTLSDIADYWNQLVTNKEINTDYTLEVALSATPDDTDITVTWQDRIKPELVNLHDDTYCTRYHGDHTIVAAAEHYEPTADQAINVHLYALTSDHIKTNALKYVFGKILQISTDEHENHTTPRYQLIPAPINDFQKDLPEYYQIRNKYQIDEEDFTPLTTIDDFDDAAQKLERLQNYIDEIGSHLETLIEHDQHLGNEDTHKTFQEIQNHIGFLQDTFNQYESIIANEENSTPTSLNGTTLSSELGSGNFHIEPEQLLNEYYDEWVKGNTQLERFDNYNILVRDKIPELLAQEQDIEPITKTLSGTQYEEKLFDQTKDTFSQLRLYRSIDQIVDLIELLTALAEHYGYDEEQLEKRRNEKADELGRYDDQISIFEVEEK